MHAAAAAPLIIYHRSIKPSRYQYLLISSTEVPAVCRRWLWPTGNGMKELLNMGGNGQIAIVIKQLSINKLGMQHTLN